MKGTIRHFWNCRRPGASESDAGLAGQPTEAGARRAENAPNLSETAPSKRRQNAARSLSSL